jgi:hypothetical protein
LKGKKSQGLIVSHLVSAQFTAQLRDLKSDSFEACAITFRAVIGLRGHNFPSGCAVSAGQYGTSVPNFYCRFSHKILSALITDPPQECRAPFRSPSSSAEKVPCNQLQQVSSAAPSLSSYESQDFKSGATWF